MPGPPGQILFTRPTVEEYSTQAQLALGGSHVVAPTDIYMLLAYSRGALETSYPSSGYSGTAYSVAGLSRTQFVDVETWGYGGNTSLMNQLAQMVQQSVCNTLMEGMVNYKGFYSTVQSPTGLLLNFAGNGYTTGDEAVNIPVRAVSYQYMNQAGGGLNYTTSIKCSNRQDPRTGEGYYTHLSVLGSGIQLKSYGQVGGNAQFTGSILGEAQEQDTSGMGPVFNADEIRAGNAGQARESGAMGRMQSDESDSRPQAAANSIAGSENQAMSDLTSGARRAQAPAQAPASPLASGLAELSAPPPAAPAPLPAPPSLPPQNFDSAGSIATE
jgi:hypothetical protein